MTAEQRDLSQAQFEAKCAKLGFKAQGFMGYYDLGIPGHSWHSSVLNAGPRRRRQLAYLLDERKRRVAQIAAETAVTT